MGAGSSEPARAAAGPSDESFIAGCAKTTELRAMIIEGPENRHQPSTEVYMLDFKGEEPGGTAGAAARQALAGEGQPKDQKEKYREIGQGTPTRK